MFFAKEYPMKHRLCYGLWACLFILCAGLGFIPEPEGSLSAVLSLLALLFFLPPAWLLYQSGKHRQKDTALLIRNLSLVSLILTVTVLILNFFTAFASQRLGQILHYVLVIVSSPMICSGHWAMSLFLWACLLMVSLRQLKR